VAARPEPHALAIAASVDLDADEQHLLEAALRGAMTVAGERAVLSAPAGLSHGAPETVAHWQYSLDVDPDSVLVLTLNAASEAVAAEAARRLTEEFWLGVKGVLSRVRRRRPGAPVSSVQVQAPLEPAGGVPAEVSLTALHAEYAGDVAWAQTMTEAVRTAKGERDRAVAAIAGPDGRIPQQVTRSGSKIVVYGFVEGGGTLEWHTEVQPE
jgi:hypothetical protein